MAVYLFSPDLLCERLSQKKASILLCTVTAQHVESIVFTAMARRLPGLNCLHIYHSRGSARLRVGGFNNMSSQKPTNDLLPLENTLSHNHVPTLPLTAFITPSSLSSWWASEMCSSSCCPPSLTDGVQSCNVSGGGGWFRSPIPWPSSYLLSGPMAAT